MELSDLITDKQCLKDLIPNPKGGEGLTVWFCPDAMTPRDRRRVLGMSANEDEAEAIMDMIEIMKVEWNLKKDGVPVSPTKATDDGSPCMQDVSLKALLAVIQAIMNSISPKETSTDPLSAS